MNSSIWITIPTYWGIPGSEENPAIVDFDHPSSPATDGTLERTLESLKILEDNFTLLLILAVTHNEYINRAVKRVKSIAGKFKMDFPVYIVSPENLPVINDTLDDPLLSLDSYGNIRNVQLAVPYIMNADIVVGIDDDEVIEDPCFLSKVTEYTGKEYQGELVAGTAGPYFNRKGGYVISGAEELKNTPNMFIKKNYFMNEALKKVMSQKEDIVKSNVAFGGNMSIPRETIRCACHDPYIPRGEDYDYVINAWMKGKYFFFQPGMGIVHLPPDSTGSQAGDNIIKMLADIKRFLYMQGKMKYYFSVNKGKDFDKDYLLPYPGVYFDEELDLESQAVEALKLLYPDYGDKNANQKFVKEAVRIAGIKVREFFLYSKRWEKAMDYVDHNQQIGQVIDENCRV